MISKTIQCMIEICTLHFLELVEFLRDGTRKCRPTIQNKDRINPSLMALLLDCWNDSPDRRPSIRRVRLSTEAYLKVLANYS